MSEAVTDFDAEAAEAKLTAVPHDAKPEQAALVLFPDSEQLREKYLQREQALRDGLTQAHAEVEGPSAKALPAIVVAALPITARCVWGSLSGAVIGQVSNYVKNNEMGQAKDLIVDACIGCITGVVPFISKPVARKISGEVAGAILWLIVQLGPKS